jgi:hypothetical protein
VVIAASRVMKSFVGFLVNNKTPTPRVFFGTAHFKSCVLELRILRELEACFWEVRILKEIARGKVGRFESWKV